MEGNNENNNFFDFSLIDHFPVPGGELPSLEPGFHWSANSFPGSTSVVSKGFSDSYGKSDASHATKEDESRKRAHPGSCSGTKACREKKRRDKLNERFQELNEILDPGRSAKTDKTVILADAIRMITHLRNEATNLKDSSQDLLVKINELKVEKNELRDEKQKLKTDRETRTTAEIHLLWSSNRFLSSCTSCNAGPMSRAPPPLVETSSCHTWDSKGFLCGNLLLQLRLILPKIMFIDHHLHRRNYAFDGKVIM